MERSNAAVARGEARPLRDILAVVQKQHPGRLLEVRFRTSWGKHTYLLRMVSRRGSIDVVTVEAATGRIQKIGGC